MISIILATYNNEKTISSAIKSILNQSHSNFELIIVNDFSNDNTKEKIKSFKDNRIIYIENESNIGRSQSRNKGFLKAKGDFIAIMDGDDISIPERLKIQLNYLLKNPNVKLVGSNIIYFTDHKVIGLSKLKLYPNNNFNFILRTIGLPNVTWMARADFFKKFNYNPKIVSAEDQDLLLKAYDYSQFTLLNDPLVFVRIPKNINIKYKLKQLYNLLISRIFYICRKKLLYYIPLVILIYIIQSILFILKINIRYQNQNSNSNSKYQNLLNKLIK